ncbi:MAG: cbb3-type cytochrome c oxidase subunit I [Vulcanimicrobiota bacterium]
MRICPVTGLKVCPDAEALVRWHAVTAVVHFLIGVSAAILLVLTRWQAVHLLPSDWYYRILTAHGLNMLIFFIIFFEMAVLHFAGPILLNCRQPAPKVGWLAYTLMLVGACTTNGFVFAGKADVLFTSYVPLKAHPAYYLGIILFAVGALLDTSLFFAALVKAKKEKTYTGSVPLVTYGALTAAIIAVITLVHGAMVYVPTFLWSLGLMNMDPEVYRMVWWALGHSSQQINVAAHVSCWYLLAGLTVGGVVLNEKVSRGAFFLYVLFISMASAHHLLVDPGVGPAWKVWNTSYAMYLAVLASMVHGFTVPAGIETGQRLRGFNQGRFQWLTKAPWGDPGFAALWLSLVIFGFGGGITGVVIGTEQINIIAHNTLRIPGHFHMTVVGGTALCFMGVTYYLLPLIFRRRVAFYRLAQIQPYLFGAGISLMGIAMTYAGSFGVPRRHWDISFTQAPFGVQFPTTVDLFMAGMAIGGILAFLGGISYCLIAVVSVFFTPALSDDDLKGGGPGLPPGVVKLPSQTHSSEASEAAHRQGNPGTVVLVGVFFVCFILYYFTNWKILSLLWKVG